jgi:hypothetical protein
LQQIEENDEWLNRATTVDESWGRGFEYDTETTQQSMKCKSPDSALPEKARVSEIEIK